MENLEQALNDFLLSENENMVGFLNNLKKDYSLDSIYDILIKMFLNTEKDNVLLRNRILMLLNVFFQIPTIKIYKRDLIALDNLLGQTSYLTNFEGLDDALVAELIYKKNILDRECLVNKETIIKEKGIEEQIDLSFKNDSLVENELFGIHAYDLLAINYFNLERSHGFFTPSFINYNPLFQNTFLIFSYLGDNLCREFYTGKVVNISSDIDIMYLKDNDETLNSSVKSFQTVRKSPLVINSCIYKISDKYEVNDNFKRIISAQSEQKEQIAAAINEMFDRVDKKNKANIEKAVNEDYSFAEEISSLECELIEFKKDTKNLILEREENKKENS